MNQEVWSAAGVVFDAALRGDRPGLIAGIRKLIELLSAIDVGRLTAFLETLLGLFPVKPAALAVSITDEELREIMTGPDVNAAADIGGLIALIRLLLELFARIKPILNPTVPTPTPSAE